WTDLLNDLRHRLRISVEKRGVVARMISVGLIFARISCAGTRGRVSAEFHCLCILHERNGKIARSKNFLVHTQIYGTVRQVFKRPRGIEPGRSVLPAGAKTEEAKPTPWRD